jgi:hypothetical protein
MAETLARARRYPGGNIYANRYTDTSSPADCGFFKLMMVWKGSVFKLLWLDVVVYLVSYFALTLLYRVVFLHVDQYREIFEAVCIYSSRCGLSVG